MDSSFIIRKFQLRILLILLHSSHTRSYFLDQIKAIQPLYYNFLTCNTMKGIDIGAHVLLRFCNKHRSALFIFRKCPLFLQEKSALEVLCPSPSLRYFLCMYKFAIKKIYKIFYVLNERGNIWIAVIITVTPWHRQWQSFWGSISFSVKKGVIHSAELGEKRHVEI